MTDQERQIRERFRALDLPTAPVTLERTLDDGVPVTPPARRRGSRRPWALLAVAAVLVCGGALLATGSMRPVVDEAAPLGSPPAVVVEDTPEPATPAPTPVPSDPLVIAQGLDAELGGLRVHSVSELLDERAAGTLPEGSLALAGWWSSTNLAFSCPWPGGDTGELELYCSDGQFGITERHEPFATLLDALGQQHQAQGPSITPFVEVSLGGMFSMPPINGQVPTVPIVVVGHFDDPRAADCRAEARQLCRDRFVIERIVQFDPAIAPTPAPTLSPSPFPLDSPPPLSLDVGMCAAERTDRATR